jgi:hypothetical protein
MAATTLKYSSVPAIAAPRGAGWAANAFAAVLKGGNSLVRRIAEYQRRSSELRARQELLRMADAFARTQPGFASDLRAAAARAGEGL